MQVVWNGPKRSIKFEPIDNDHAYILGVIWLDIAQSEKRTEQILSQNYGKRIYDDEKVYTRKEKKLARSIFATNPRKSRSGIMEVAQERFLEKGN